MITVFKTAIKIGNKETPAYTANEKDEDGSFINYLNNTQLAELIGLHRTTTVENKIPQELKNLLGKDFTSVEGRVKTVRKGYIKVSLWDTPSCTKYIAYHAKKGNNEALEILIALASTTLDQLINDAFDREYKKGDAEKTVSARLKGKMVRRTLTDAIQDYIAEHLLYLSQKEKSLIYAQATDLVNLGIFGRRAGALKHDWDCKSPRDSMTERELIWVAEVEDLTMRLIDQDGLHPFTAVNEALSRLIIPTVGR